MLNLKKVRARVAVIGTGNIGTDLCERLLLSDDFEVVAFVGRRPDSPGLERLKGRIPFLLSEGISSLMDLWVEIDGVFDATSAQDHKEHWEIIQAKNKWAIDLTPSKIGTPMVPELIGKISAMAISEESVANYSMVTCGGQSSAPLIFGICENSSNIKSIEVSSSIASLSAGPATRRNIDQYIASTEGLATIISGQKDSKAIIVLNPSEPPVMMRTTVTVEADIGELPKAILDTRNIVRQVQAFVPGFELVVEPHLRSPGVISATVKVTGAGHYLPQYAGNLDIINAAAVETARLHFERHS